MASSSPSWKEGARRERPLPRQTELEKTKLQALRLKKRFSASFLEQGPKLIFKIRHSPLPGGRSQGPTRLIDATPAPAAPTSMSPTSSQPLPSWSDYSLLRKKSGARGTSRQNNAIATFPPNKNDRQCFRAFRERNSKSVSLSFFWNWVRCIPP
jgi:hypothetical protein